MAYSNSKMDNSFCVCAKFMGIKSQVGMATRYKLGI